MQSQPQASTSSYTPPLELESEIWGSTRPIENENGTTGGSPSSSPEIGGRRTLRSRKNVETPRMTHPLSTLITPPTIHTDVLGDVSRPNLKRLTSETERQVAESSTSGSLRGSLDLLRMTPTDGGGEGEESEVEVLIHTIKSNESLAGIALLYGIDLATLRKSNKLWSSDPLHIRTHLYVPLEACRWNKAKEILVRGPGDGQVTLMPKTNKDKGKGKEVYNLNSGVGQNGLSHIMDLSDSPPSASTSTLSLASTFLPSTNHSYTQETSPPTATEPLVDEHTPTPRVLDVVRIPSSQLRFFPKPKPEKPPDRRSLDYFSSGSKYSPGSNTNTNTLSSPLSRNGRPSGEIERKSIEDTLHGISALRRNSQNHESPNIDGPTIINDLSTLPPPLRPTPASPTHPSSSSSSSTSKGRSKSTIVKIRPPIIQISSQHQRNHSNGMSLNMEGIKGSIKDFFTVPPPPPSNYGTLGKSKPRNTDGQRERMASSPSTLSLGQNSPISKSNGSPINGNGKVVRKQESMELKTRYSDLGLDLGLGGLGINVGQPSSTKGGVGRKDSFGAGGKGDKQD
ncbi:hypothetical protein V865_001782 [Kwoniella europaea PYCC6329]|uniref:LysM domain-containing protein n=1 Tax=Kwoniella europaea PYCC6329 TaxID=1423913 RepID=A0AAX4KB45_9TREE